MTEKTLNRIKSLVSMLPKRNCALTDFQRGRISALREIAEIIDCVNEGNLDPHILEEGDVLFTKDVTGSELKNTDGTTGLRLTDSDGLTDVRLRQVRYIPLKDNPYTAGDFRIIVQKIKDKQNPEDKNQRKCDYKINPEDYLKFLKDQNINWFDMGRQMAEQVAAEEPVKVKPRVIRRNPMWIDAGHANL